jgi:phasin family protein
MDCPAQEYRSADRRQSGRGAGHAGGGAAPGRNSQPGHERSVSIAQQLSSAGNPQEMTAKQAELARKAFEQALANMRELAEMVSKSNTEAFAIINKRVTESLQELKSLVAK